jgi:hypothetical protein
MSLALRQRCPRSGHAEAVPTFNSRAVTATYALIRSCYSVCFFQYITSDDTD